MVLVQFSSNNLKVFGSEVDAFEAIEKANIHPDLLRIFHGNFNEIKYKDLLKMNNIEINYEKMNIEVSKIVKNTQDNIIENTTDNFVISHRLYPYGSVKDHVFLQAGFNPLLVILVNFGVSNSEIDTRKLRKIAVNSVENEWEVLKVRQEKDTTEKFIYGNHPTTSYSIFAIKHRDKLEV